MVWRASFSGLSWSFLGPWKLWHGSYYSDMSSCMIFLPHYGFKSDRVKWPWVKILETLKLTKSLVLVRVTFAVMKSHQHSNLGEKRVYLVHNFTSLFIIEGTQDRNSNRTGTWRQELMLRSWRSEALWLAQSVFLQNSGPPDQGWCHPFINQQLSKCSSGLPTACSYEGIFSMKVFSSQMTKLS